MLPHHPQPRRFAGRGGSASGAATRCDDQCLAWKRSPAEMETPRESSGWTSDATQRVSRPMDKADPDNADAIDLVVQLCTRIGIMMEDVCPVALDAAREGLKERVANLQGAIQVMMTIADAAEAMLRS